MKRDPYRNAIALGALITLGLLGASCEQDVATPGPATAVTATAKATATQAAKAKVAKIVFVGKRDACDCTRKRVDDSFAALQSALTGRQEIPVERIRVDTDPIEVAPYEQLRAIMVLPAVYLLDESGGLVEVLQGEVTAAQLEALL